MIQVKTLLLPSLIILLFSCRNESSKTTLIKDFREPLQPHLTEIVSNGIVTYQPDSIWQMFRDNEIKQLSQSEHPVLRATALREMMHRKSFDQFEIIMHHLDDTAIVPTDAGEFGTWFRKVSDYILDEATWESQEQKNKTIDLVLKRHNYLTSAYIILLKIEPQEKYYPFIKDMATRPRRLSDGYELGFGDIEYALFGLAKYKKMEDVQLIKKRLMEHVGRLSSQSFTLMRMFPDTAYFDVLQQYHRRQFYRFSGNRPGGFSGYYADRAAPEDFIDALIVQETDKSAKLLDTMLARLDLFPCMPDKRSIKDRLLMSIWEHPCPVYATLRQKIKAEAKKASEGYGSIPMDAIPIEGDTTRPTIRW